MNWLTVGSLREATRELSADIPIVIATEEDGPQAVGAVWLVDEPTMGYPVEDVPSRVLFSIVDEYPGLPSPLPRVLYLTQYQPEQALAEGDAGGA